MSANIHGMSLQWRGLMVCVDSNCSKAAAHPWPTTGGDGMQQMPGTKPRWGQLLATGLRQIMDCWALCEPCAKEAGYTRGERGGTGYLTLIQVGRRRRQKGLRRAV